MIDQTYDCARVVTVRLIQVSLFSKNINAGKEAMNLLFVESVILQEAILARKLDPILIKCLFIILASIANESRDTN